MNVGRSPCQGLKEWYWWCNSPHPPSPRPTAAVETRHRREAAHGSLEDKGRRRTAAPTTRRSALRPACSSATTGVPALLRRLQNLGGRQTDRRAEPEGPAAS